MFNYDRRDDSGDTQPYAVAREVQDIDAAGGSASLYGTSSGVALAITKLALWEPPFILDRGALTARRG